MSDKTQKLRELSVDELRKRLNDAREEQMKLRFQQATGELTDHTRLRYNRRLIARIVTLIDQKERGAQMEGEA